jgi:transcriptional regulator with XRE-family HTH domain
MTPSQQAKAAGLKSLLQVSELTGVSIQTLSNWAKNKPKLFAIVLKGAWMQWFKEVSEANS